MDITKVNDINTLKSMAYDRVLLIEKSTLELRDIQDQISKLEKQDEEKSRATQES